MLVQVTISKLVLMGIECFIIDLEISQNFMAMDELDRANTALMVHLSII